MRKTLLSALLMGIALGIIVSVASPASAQVSGSLWKLTSNHLLPINSTWGITVPSLANLNCIGTNGSGVFGAGTCTGGTGGGLATTTPWLTGNVSYVVDNGHVSSVATTTLIAGSNITLSGTPVIIGSSPITISASGSGTVGTSSSETAGQIPFWTTNSATPALLSGGNANFVWDNTNRRLGIGTSSPFAKLSVMAGDSYTSQAPSTVFAIGSSTAGTATSTLFVVNSSGNVGIGTANPAAQLDISGAYSSTGANYLNFSPTFTTSYTGSVISTLLGGTINPTGATGSSAVTNLAVANTITGSSNIGVFRGISTQVALGSSYSGTLTTGVGLEVAAPYFGGAHPSYNNFGVRVLSVVANGEGISSGSATNYNFYAAGATASTTAGGTLSNYDFYGVVPSGSPNGGTTNNYGLRITGNGGSSNGGTVNNYALYADSTAQSYFAGNVGIGTTTPKWPLNILSATTPQLTLDSTGANPLSLRAVGGNFYLAASSPTTFATTTTYLTVLNGGNVGIGTTNPVAKLDILGTASSTDLFAANTLTVSTSTAGCASFNASGLLYSTGSVCGGGAVSSVSNSDGTLTISPTTGAVVGSLNLAHSNTWTALQQFNGNASTTGLTVSGYTYLATASGNVGIGTTTPGALLSINGAWNSTTPLFMVGTTTLTASTTVFQINNNGKTVGTDIVNSFTGVLSPTRSFVLGTGTTTTWTASTTGSAYSPFLVMPFSGTLRQSRCATDASFLGVNVQVNGSDITPKYFVASTTIGAEKFSAGNTFTAGQKILANFGTTTTAGTTQVNCTFDVTETI